MMEQTPIMACPRLVGFRVSGRQINIAQEGGKQINVQGEVSGQQVPQTAM